MCVCVRVYLLSMEWFMIFPKGWIPPIQLTFYQTGMIQNRIPRETGIVIPSGKLT